MWRSYLVQIFRYRTKTMEKITAPRIRTTYSLLFCILKFILYAVSMNTEQWCSVSILSSSTFLCADAIWVILCPCVFLCLMPLPALCLLCWNRSNGADSWPDYFYRKSFIFISVPLKFPKRSIYQVIFKGPVSSNMLCKTIVMKRHSK